jgi:hypothetical protein
MAINPTMEEMDEPKAGAEEAQETKQAKRKPVQFPTPAGFEAPDPSDEAKEGEFDLVCTFRPTEDGKNLRMIRLGDFELPDEDPKEEKREKQPDYGDMISPIMSSMQQPE